LSNDLKTPNIDALAKEGVICTAGYVTAPQCAPSRAGLMTGRYNQRIGFDTIPDGPLPLEEVTIAERLRDLGYATGHVGKWHLEPNHTCVKWARKEYPGQVVKQGNQEAVKLNQELVVKYQSGNQGFDDFFSGELNHYWCNYDLDGKDLTKGGEYKQYPESDYRLDIQTDAARAFIDRNHKKPFFLYLAYYAPHVPLVAIEKYLSRFPGEMPERRRTALAMMAAMDDGVGRIREKLEGYGLSENTIIFYIADNGAPLGAHTEVGSMADVLPVDKPGIAWDGSNNGPLSGEKGMLMEGGIRVPYLVSWPAKLPKGLVYGEPVSSLDVAATCMVAAGRSVPTDLDGVDLVPFLTGTATEPRTLCWRFWNQAAIRQGKWKYFTMGDGTEYLVDLEADIKEQHNLLAQYPEKAQQLRAKLAKWTDELDPSGLPSKPPNDQEVNWYKYYLKNERVASAIPSSAAPDEPLPASYAMLDQNADGKLSETEFVEGRATREKTALMKKDSLTEEQYQANLVGYKKNYRINFEKRDANQDGFLNAAELK
jgi:arylsulfatase A-like enzyme